MKKIVITSTNPVKLNVVKRVAAALFPAETFEYMPLPLETSGQEPIGKQMVMKQISIALDSAVSQVSDAEYYVCMEGGMVDDGENMDEVAYVTVRNNRGASATSNCASFPVPKTIADEVRKGKGFAEAVDEFFKTNGTKQGGGFVSILTDGRINKEDHYFQPTMIAFSSLNRVDWY